MRLMRQALISSGLRIFAPQYPIIDEEYSEVNIYIYIYIYIYI
jgi:hypothetical protein